MISTQVYDRTYGALLGLAMGDALGFPAMYHRTLLLKRGRRSRLWKMSQHADQFQINKFALPYTLSAPEGNLHLCGTDDTEFAVLAAKILSECGSELNLDTLFDGWHKYVVQHEQEIWTSVSERASIINSLKGLKPPATGNDNPHHFDDGAVARAVPIGLKLYGDPDRAAHVAGLMASITNAEDGIYAAQAMAACIALAVAGAEPDEIVAAGMKQIPDESWLGRKVRLAFQLLRQAQSAFAAVPLWNDQIVNGIYNYGNIASETLPIALAIFSETKGRLMEGLQVAAMIPKQADSMPAMVGALAGALHGESAIPETWQASLDELKGVCVPYLRGVSLHDTAKELLNMN